uniref:ZZ-type domain-containing protein n=1 Tax=Globodera rostochiensis TaxID=31243 RepID=A0A914GYY7_GLORO
MEEQRDIELAEDAAATEHGGKKATSVAVKWFYNGNWRRFQCVQWTIDALMAEVRALEPNFRGQLFYRDADGDAIVFGTDAEMRMMLSYFRNKLSKDTVLLETLGEQPKMDEMTPKVAASSSDVKQLHPNIICDMCDGNVVGMRYKCFLCPDFDLCEQCEKTGVHGEHPLCRLATVGTPKPFGLLKSSMPPLMPPLKTSYHHYHGHGGLGHHVKKLVDVAPPLLMDLPEDLARRAKENQQRFEAKWEKLEHKHAKRTARREQRLQDHTSRVMNRLERSAKARTMHLPVPPSAPSADVEQAQHQQENNNNARQQQDGRVDFLKSIGQRVQQALMSFGIECDAEVRDERGVLHGSVPSQPMENSKSIGVNNTGAQQKKVPEKKISPAKCRMLVDVPFCSDGILQRPQLCSSSLRMPKPSVVEAERLGHAFLEHKRRELKNLTNTSSSEKPLRSGLPPPPPSSPPSEAMEQKQTEVLAALVGAQEAVKKALPAALSGLEATSAAANRVGQSVVGAARHGAENLSEKFLSPEFLANILQQPKPTPMPAKPNTTQPTDGETKNDGRNAKLSGEVSVNAHLHKSTNTSDQSDQNVSVVEQENAAAVFPPQQAPVQQELARRLNELHLANETVMTDQLQKHMREEEGEKKAEENLKKHPNEQAKEDVSVDGKKGEEDLIDSDVEVLEIDGNLLGKPLTPVQLGSKRKLEDNKGNNDNLMKLSTHNTSSIEPDKPMDGQIEPSAETFVLDISSLSSRSSTTSSSSSMGPSSADDEDGTGWMMVKKESFKKLCDFYEKRRRVDGTMADPFAAQLEREFLEAMAALGPNNDDAVHKSVVDEQIVDLSTESGPVEPKKSDGCAHAVVMRGVCAGCGQDFRQPNELISSAAILGIQKEAQNDAALHAHSSNDPQLQSQRLYPVLDAPAHSEVCTAGLPYPGYQKPTGQKHCRRCEWIHENFIVQNVVNQLVEMGFDNCNGWLFRVVEQEGPEMDRIFAAIDGDPMYCARISLE